MTTWDVVATVKADPVQIQRFIAHYLRLGASRVFLYLDDPAADFVTSNPKVTCIYPDMSPAGLAARPVSIENRQMDNATNAAHASQSDWILHCDVDEYLDSDLPISEALGTFGPENLMVLVLPIEPVYRKVSRSFDDVMAADVFKLVRGPWLSKQFWSVCFEDLYPSSVHGFWAHRRGKSFMRPALAEGRRLPLHSYPPARAAKFGQVVAKQLTLRHYEALSFDSWLAKHRSRVEKTVIATLAGPMRANLSQLIYDTAKISEAAALDLYRRMFVLSDEQIARGIEMGLLVQRKSITELHSAEGSPTVEV